MKRLALLLIAINSYGFETGWVNEPLDCNKLSDNVITECKQVLLNKGEFEYYKVESISECRKIPDSTLVWKCVAGVNEKKTFALSKRDHDFVAIADDIEFDKNSMSVMAKSTKEMASYMKIQTILFAVTFGLGLLIAIIK